MDLTITLKQIVGLEGIPESDIVWDEVKWFEKNHKGHGPYEFLIRTNDYGKIESIEVTCMAINVPYENCPHHSTGYSELSYSSFYHESIEDEVQRQRREGTLEPED